MRKLLISLLLVLPLAVQAQTTLRDQMNEVAGQFGVNFIYDSSLELDRIANRPDRASLEEILDALFAGTGIQYEITKKYIVLHKGKKRPKTYEVLIEEESQDTLSAATITSVIDRNRNFTQTGLTKVSGKAFGRAFAFFSSPDVIKTLQQLTGVSSGTELLSSLYVHGGDGSDNLYLLDGVPLYQICHVGGLFSSFNTDVIENIDFYKSGFPARYGGRTSSVVDVTTRDGDFQKYHGSFRIGLLDGGIQFEGPVWKDRTSFNVGLRRSWMDVVMVPIGLILSAQDREYNRNMYLNYNFTDFNAKLTHKFSQTSRLTANFYWGNDTFKYIDKERHIYTNVEGENEDTDFLEQYRLNWGNILASVNWKKNFGENLDLKLTGFYSGSRSKTSLGEKYRDYLRNEDYVDMTESRGVVNDGGITADLGWRPHRNHHLRFGTAYTYHSYSPSYSFENSQVTDGVSMLDMREEEKILTDGHEMALYAEDEMTLTSWLRLNAGLRYSLYSSKGTTWNYFEPRAAVKFQICPSVNVKASYSEMSQFSHLVASSYLDLPTNSWLPSNADIAPMRSRQVAGGVYADFPMNFHLNVEGWYKTMANLTEYVGESSLYPILTQWQDNFISGQGKSYGMEVDFGYETARTSVSLFYTLSWSKRFFPQLWKDWYLDRNDNRHKITVVANHKINDRIEIYGAWNYHTGNRISAMTQYVPGIDGYPSEGIYEEPNNVKIPDYHRLDFGINIYRKTKRGNTSIWNVSLYNVYCRMNPIYAMASQNWYDYGPGLAEDDYHPDRYSFSGSGYGIIPIIPTFSYTLKF